MVKMLSFILCIFCYTKKMQKTLTNTPPPRPNLAKILFNRPVIR